MYIAKEINSSKFRSCGHGESWHFFSDRERSDLIETGNQKSRVEKPKDKRFFPVFVDVLSSLARQSTLWID